MVNLHRQPINMVAKKPTYKTQFSFSQDIGSNNHTRSVFDLSGSLNEDQTLRGRVVLAKKIIFMAHIQ